MHIRLVLAARRIGVAVGFLVLLAVLALEPAQPANADSVGKVYWTDAGTGKISRANLDGSGVEDLITGLDSPQGIALDTDGGKMYWVETGTVPGKISRSNLDGTGVEVLLTTDCCSGHSFIALDVPYGKMYWTSPDGGKVKRANIDGTVVEDIVVGENQPIGIAIDASAQKVYWTYLLGGVRRANLDGSGVQRLSSGPKQFLGGLALDEVDGVLYATEARFQGPTISAGKISLMRAFDVNATSSQTVFSQSEDGLFGVAVDDGLSSLFWTDLRLGVIGRWPQQAIVTGLDFPVGVALDIQEPKPPTATPTITPTATVTPTPPLPVGGIAQDSELRPLPAAADASESGNGIPLAAAAALGTGLLGGAALLLRRGLRSPYG